MKTFQVTNIVEQELVLWIQVEDDCTLEVVDHKEIRIHESSINEDMPGIDLRVKRKQ